MTSLKDRLEQDGIHVIVVNGRAASESDFSTEMFKVISKDHDLLMRFRDAIPGFSAAVSSVA